MKKIFVAIFLMSFSALAATSLKSPYMGQTFTGVEQAYDAKLPLSDCSLTINSDVRNQYDELEPSTTLGGELYTSAKRVSNVSIRFKTANWLGREKTNTFTNIKAESKGHPLSSQLLFSNSASGRIALDSEKTIVVYFDRYEDKFLPIGFDVYEYGRNGLITACRM